MLARATTKCFSVFFVIIFMCPGRTVPSVPIGNQQEYYHAVRRSSNIKFTDNIPPALRKHEKLSGKENLEKDEPGFDLTEEEIYKLKLWDKGMVPYYIDVLSFADKVLRDRIRWFLNLVNSLTSLSFVELPRPPKDDDTRWVFFVNRRGLLGCADHSIKNLTQKGVQRVTLGYDCMNTGGELAEAVLAIAGVPPQHNAPNRDKYIKVLEDNIIPEKQYLFEKLNNFEWLFHDVNYDFASAGHFHYHKHSANGRATIKTKSTDKAITIGKYSGFSKIDILKIKMLYNYIINKKKQKNAISQCSQLFSQGNKKGKKSLGMKKIKPRPKPLKYLGIEEEKDNDKGENKENNSKQEAQDVGEEEKNNEDRTNADRI